MLMVSILEMCKLCIQDLEYVLIGSRHAAEVLLLPRFYKILSGEKGKKNLYEV